jgi:septal ring factor EnvC (AmiA/AmiB activator)
MATSVSDVASRWAAVLAVLAAAGGWGAFFLTSEHDAALAQAQAREIRELRQGRAELETAILAERAKVADLKAVETELQTARLSLERAKESQEKAKAALTATQSELASRRTELASLAAQAARTREEQAKAEQAAAEQTASIRKAAPKRERWTRRAKRGKRYAKTG